MGTCNLHYSILGMQTVRVEWCILVLQPVIQLHNMKPMVDVLMT